MSDNVCSHLYRCSRRVTSANGKCIFVGDVSANNTEYKVLRGMPSDTLDRMVSCGGGGRYRLEEILSAEQVAQVVRRALPAGPRYEVSRGEARPAAAGLTGFLADHVRLLLHVAAGDHVRQVHLFVKRVPPDNKPKADFIHHNNYFQRETLMLRLFDNMNGTEGPRAWCVPAYVCTESLIVMPDLAAAGYAEHALLEPLDWRHAALAAASLARYHAAFADYETDILNAAEPYHFHLKHEQLLEEPTFKDTPWVRTAAKLTADLLDAFSSKYSKQSVPGLEEKLAASYVAACESLHVAGDTLNVMLHKDLWNNNILFKYEGGEPVNAILIDYQCVRYGPPAFDVMSFLYLTTSGEFRDQREGELLKHYWEVFSGAVHDGSRKRLAALGYGELEFLSWCERSRMFGAFEAAALFPQVLMEASEAARVFDDPATFQRVVNEDRSPPVVRYARRAPPRYTRRNLHAAEEYVERFILGRP